MGLCSSFAPLGVARSDDRSFTRARKGRTRRERSRFRMRILAGGARRRLFVFSARDKVRPQAFDEHQDAERDGEPDGNPQIGRFRRHQLEDAIDDLFPARCAHRALPLPDVFIVPTKCKFAKRARPRCRAERLFSCLSRVHRGASLYVSYFAASATHEWPSRARQARSSRFRRATRPGPS